MAPESAIDREGKSRRRRPLRVAVLALAVTLVIALSIGAWCYAELSSNVKSVDIDAALGSERPKDADNSSKDILVLGSDSRAGANRTLAGGNTGSTSRSDTAMIVHIPAGAGHATAVSIPRDTLVTRPACTTSSGTALPLAERVMFNSVHTSGGPACVVRTVENMTGIRVDHYIEVDFAGFKALVDALGGVPVTVDHAIQDKESGLSLEAGTHRLDGTQSLAFVRTRHGIGDGSDLGRIGLQQQFLLAVLSEIKSQGVLSSPTKLFAIADAATKALTTDSGLSSLTDLADFAKSLKGLDPHQMDTLMLPVEYDKRDPNRVVAADPQARELWDALKADRSVPDSARRSPATGG